MKKVKDLRALRGRRPEMRLISSSEEPLSRFLDLDLWDEAATVAEIRMPSLDERREDVPVLFETYLRLAVRSLDTDMPDVPATTLSELMTRPWPGNLPELRNHAMSYALGTRVHNESAGQRTLAEQMEAFERMVLSETLTRTNGKAAEAATLLGLPRNTFYDRLARFGLAPKTFRETSSPKD